jgi:hypothetical protein
VDHVAGRIEDARDSVGDVEDVHERPPRRPVGGHADLTGEERARREVVDDEIETLARRRSVRGGVAHEGRREVVVGQRRHLSSISTLHLA